jgi:hypothetical protein
MTANELRDALIVFCARNGGLNGEAVVFVPTANASIGPSACSKAKSIHGGSDWDAGRLFIATEDDLVVEKPWPSDLSKLAAERLAAIRDGHARCGFEYLPKAHSRAWCDGFKEGVQQHYTGPAEAAETTKGPESK